MIGFCTIKLFRKMLGKFGASLYILMFIHVASDAVLHNHINVMKRCLSVQTLCMWDQYIYIFFIFGSIRSRFVKTLLIPTPKPFGFKNYFSVFKNLEINKCRKSKFHFYSFFYIVINFYFFPGHFTFLL